ncbi:MAG: hypothetical protein KC877_02300 [Candidatus Kaiserbacteria bacterium]|nr:hypothetical protein [Candidatus Kaiserbacteria bacterium]MCB9816844.1 hypothetical protein [Candidatus Nomurabacteria bacterium]
MTISRQIVNSFDQGTIEYVIAHMIWRRQRGKNTPTATLPALGLTNARTALRYAVRKYREKEAIIVDKHTISGNPDITPERQTEEDYAPGDAIFIFEGTFAGYVGLITNVDHDQKRATGPIVFRPGHSVGIATGPEEHGSFDEPFSNITHDQVDVVLGPLNTMELVLLSPALMN